MSSPTPKKPDDLDRALTEMTIWLGVEPELWKAALSSNKAKPEVGRKWRLDSMLSKSLSSRLMLAGVGCIALVFVVAAMLPSLGRARGVSAPNASVTAMLPDSYKDSAESRRSTETSDMPSVAAKPTRQGGVTWAQSNTDGPAKSSPVSPETAQPAVSPRYVVQKATMTLQTDDVRAAFAQAAHLVSEAGGEFVENSSLTGDGKSAQGNLTLRIAAGRIGEVMNKLRELGTVKSENTTGEDVTTQVVDVEARIRNEQRVEKELLELLEKRNDAPLKDVLELRSSLASVRQSIEQLVGQRDRLGRLVSLASILVVIRAEPAEFKSAKSSIGDYFTSNIDRAWRGGVRYLSDSVAWLIAVAIGGVVWWIVLAGVIVSVVRWRRRLSARCV